jgi:CRISPR-associated endonuclease Csn1
VLAATSEARLQELTKAAQEAERHGKPRGFDFEHVPSPAGFREAMAVADVFVSRAERRRARGEAHAATIKQVRQIDGTAVVFERKPVEKLTLADLENIPVPVPYGRIADPAKLRDNMVEELRGWIEAGRPKDAVPRSPKGNVIRKVRVASKDKVAVEVRGGTADRGDMARVDVFAKADKRGKSQFYLVPVYPHQIASRTQWPIPPDRPALIHKPDSKWESLDESFIFRFSIFSNSLIEVISSKGEIMMGYFRGFDVWGGSINIGRPENPRKFVGRPGARTLLGFRKLSVNQLGRVSEIEREIRTWHGEAYT